MTKQSFFTETRQIKRPFRLHYTVFKVTTPSKALVGTLHNRISEPRKSALDFRPVSYNLTTLHKKNTPHLRTITETIEYFCNNGVSFTTG